MPIRSCNDPAAWGRVLAIGAHPDDLALGASSVLLRARDAHGVIVTSGALRGDASSLAATRRAEEVAAMAVLGLAENRLHFLDIPDQDAYLRLDELIAALLDRMRRLRPAVVVTHDYEQGHPDHDAAAFAGAVAAAELAIPCYAYPLYHRENGGVRFCRFRRPAADQRIHRLDGAELAAKREALAAYASQRSLINSFPLDSECLRPLDARQCAWRETEETVYERIPSIPVEPEAVLTAICRWLDANPAPY